MDPLGKKDNLDDKEFYDEILRKLVDTKRDTLDKVKSLTRLFEERTNSEDCSIVAVMYTCILFANALELTDKQVIEYKNELLACITCDSSAINIVPFKKTLSKLMEEKIFNLLEFYEDSRRSEIGLQLRLDGQDLFNRIKRLSE